MGQERRRRWFTLELALASVLALGAWLVVSERDDDAPTAAQLPEAERRSESVDPVTRGCALADDILVRLWRGHDPVRSEDVTMVPREPNFIGTFDLTSHSGPWDYLQRIPLVLYGPEHIAASGAPVSRAVNITDVYPTVGRLLDMRLPERDGRALTEALSPDNEQSPRLVVVVVWDGAGRNTLRHWPDRWPTLRRLEREGTSYANATVGSSPSVTSAIHSNLGTGTWPRAHGVIGNDIRERDGGLHIAFASSAAGDLRSTTFADEVDAAYANESKVGLLGWKPWHIGMLGHGAALEGADRDELGLIKYHDGVEIFGNESLYATPSYLAHEARIDDHVDRLDRVDGQLDGQWLGHDISLGRETNWTTYSNPAWAGLEADLVLDMLDAGSYGRDEVPDFLFVNFKMTDLAGHQWAIDSQETADVLEAQDEALGHIVDYLERAIGNYVLVLTSDHGHSMTPATTGAWPISQDRLIADIDAHFRVPNDSTLVEASAAFGLYLDEQIMRAVRTSRAEIAEFINGYTIRDNWSEDDLPPGYEDRGDEQVFSAAFAKTQLDTVMRCAFGTSTPPDTAGA